MFFRFTTILAGFCLIGGLPSGAQMRDNTEKQLDCRGGRSRQARSCDVRETSMPASPALNVDAGSNGGVQVKGWSKAEVLVRARVEAWAAEEARAKSLAAQVKVVAQSGRVSAEGPTGLNKEGWAVSFEIFAPHKTGVTAKAHNGGITLNDISGVIELTTSNGGLHLARLAGRVKGTTTNGGVSVELAGDRWDGESLDLRTTNGGIHVRMPATYNAQVEAGATNGGMHFSAPVNASASRSKSISVKVGSGGALLRFNTVNGGISIGSSDNREPRRRERTV